MINCAGCEYNTRRDTEHRVPAQEVDMLGELKEIADIERMNFLAWYRDATVEEIAIARRNGADRLDGLRKKYAAEIKLMDIVGRAIDQKTACDIAMKNAMGTL